MEKNLFMSLNFECQLSFDVTDGYFVFLFLLHLEMLLLKQKKLNVGVYIYLNMHFCFKCIFVFRLNSAHLKQREKKKSSKQ